MLGNVPEAFRPPHVPSPSLASLAVGESVADFVGPLERPTHMEQFGRVLCGGGGVGVATLHPIARAMAEAGNDVTTVIGARSKNLLMLEAELRSFSREVQIATDDGTAGHHGFVTEVVKQLLEQGSYDLAVVIGPAPEAEMSNAPSAGWTFRS